MQSPTEPLDTDRIQIVDDAQSDLDPDELFHLLQSERRRLVARHLLEFVGEPVPVDALAGAVVRQECDVAAEGLDPEVRERVSISLDHCHLPTLDDAGVVDYDRKEGRVTPTARLRELEGFLAARSGDDQTGPTIDAEVLAGVVGGSLATLLAVRIRTAVGLVVGLLVGLLVAASVLVSTSGRERRERL